jgi:hypothetical protein
MGIKSLGKCIPYIGRSPSLTGILFRDTIREAMKDNAPGAAKRRCPGNKTKIPRKNLTSQGVFQELHFDGHEKLSSAALKMGQVGISIYGSRDHVSGVACNLRAVPDARHAVVIGHVYLDLVLEFGGESFIFLHPLRLRSPYSYSPSSDGR